MTKRVTGKLLFRAKQMRYWWKMLRGRSYYHKAQPLGKVFEPHRLKGYFNDLTGKTLWLGEVDSDGIPVDTMVNGKKFQFPILITQKALGHWDRWLIENNKQDRMQFLNLSDWLLRHQDENGGWDTWGPIWGREHQKYSAMTQGQALSVLSRASSLTGDSKYQQSAEKAFELFLIPVEKGGVTYFTGNGVFLEEIPAEPRGTVLNGWIFALFGLFDFSLLVGDVRVRGLFERSIAALSLHLLSYDSGYWSYYDFRKRLSSPFYHNLHINQLAALVMVSKDPGFVKYHARWSAYRDDFTNRTRAFVTKAYQKLREPDTVGFVK